MLAHASFNALAKRSPGEFRSVVSVISVEKRNRMEISLREATTSITPKPSQRASTDVAAPKIALKLDFTAFGTK